MLFTTYDLDARAPLYHRYAGQVNPQPAYLEIDTEARAVSWESNPEIGNGVPSRVWHNIVQRCPCSAELSAAQIETLSEELRPLIERVCDGVAVEWDGSNYVGRPDDDAEQALAEIQARLDAEEGECHVWESAAEYYRRVVQREWTTDEDAEGDEQVAAVMLDDLRITATTTDAEIDALETRLADDAWCEECTVLVDLGDYLTGLRDACCPAPGGSHARA